MKANFIKELNLTDQLREKLSLFNAKPKEIDGEKFVELYLETNSTFTVEDMAELIKKMALLFNKEPYKDKINVRLSDVHILNNKAITEDYELYTFIRFVLSHFAAINHSKYFVELDDQGNATIYLSKESYVPEIKKYLALMIKLFKNFGIYNGTIDIKFDASKFDFTFFSKKIADTMLSQIGVMENPKAHPDFELVKPFLAKEDVEKAYFEGKVFSVDKRTVKNNLIIEEYKLAKGFEAITVIRFQKTYNAEETNISKGDYIRAYGRLK